MKRLKILLLSLFALPVLMAMNGCNVNSSETAALLPTKNVAAVFDSATGVVTVTWDTVQDTDVVGYLVYRRQSDSALPVLISSNIVLHPPFEDTPPRISLNDDSTPYLYQIKTVDRNGDPSVLFSNPATIVLPPLPGQHFPLLSSTMALWTFNSHAGTNGSAFTDVSPHGFNLTDAGDFILTPSPFDSAVNFTGSGYVSVANSPLLTIGNTHKITFEARIYMSSYSAPNNVNGSSEIMGMYENRILIASDGTLYLSSQKVNGDGSYWYGAQSQPGVIPLNRWVDVAMALDDSAHQIYAYIDEKAIALYGTQNNDSFRVPMSPFTVGDDGVDELGFTGKIDEIRVSDNLVLGAGFPIASLDSL
jgi:hypothetical protein